jgi:hypothetical protein
MPDEETPEHESEPGEKEATPEPPGSQPKKKHGIETRPEIASLDSDPAGEPPRGLFGGVGPARTP